MFNLNVCCCMLGWEDIEKWKGYQAGTSGSEFNLPDFSARLTCAANMDMDGEVMGAKGGPPPELEPKKAQNTRKKHQKKHQQKTTRAGAQKGPKYPWKSSQRNRRTSEQVYNAQ